MHLAIPCAEPVVHTTVAHASFGVSPRLVAHR